LSYKFFLSVSFLILNKILFLNKIFDEFKINKLYLPSSEDHPVWNKIATKTDITINITGKELTIFTLTKKQLNRND